MTDRVRAIASLSGEHTCSPETLAAAKLAGTLAAQKAAELAPFGPGARGAKAEIEIAANAENVHVTAAVNAGAGAEAAALFAVTAAAQTLADLSGAHILSIRPAGGTKDTAPTGTPFPRKPVTATPTRVRVQPATLMGEVSAPKPPTTPGDRRSGFRAFMAANHLRITDWADEAGVPVGIIYGFLTGTSGSIPREDAEKLAKAAGVTVEDMYKG